MKTRAYEETSSLASELSFSRWFCIPVGIWSYRLSVCETLNDEEISEPIEG